MKQRAAAIVIVLSLAFSGGCAVVPALVTTGASMAVPQTASMVITAASTVHKTVLIAADERHADDMLSDKFMTLQAQAVLLTEPGADMDAACYNGDLYLVGEFATPEDHDRIIARMRKINGVRAVKGVIRQRPADMLAALEPAAADSHAEAVIKAGLIKELHVRSANVDVEVVQGEAVVTGVVGDREEAREILAMVRDLRPKSDRRIAVTSLLVRQDAYEAREPQDNAVFALRTRRERAARAETVPPSPEREAAMLALETGGAGPAPELEGLYDRYFPAEPSAWHRARRRMKSRILDLAKAEHDPEAKRELITLSSRVLKDRRISIERRLVRTLTSTSNNAVRTRVDRLLDDYAPERAERINVLAMN